MQRRTLYDHETAITKLYYKERKERMEREIILPGAVSRGLIAVIVFLISLGILSLGDYSTNTDTTGASAAVAETETELTAE